MEVSRGQPAKDREQSRTIEHRQREIILQLLLWPGNSKRFLPGTGSFVSHFDFCLCVNDLPDVSGTLP